MTVFEIKTNTSDYPFLVIADSFGKAIEQLKVKKIFEGDIISVNRLEVYHSNHILIEDVLIAREEIEKEVRRELSQTMPRWKKISNGAAGGGGDRDVYLIRSSKGYYFTSSSIAGDDTFYIELESLENLPGLEKGE